VATWKSGKPQLSIITALYNCLPLTQAMVASLQASLGWWISYEVILVDDGSTDGTREWLATLKKPFRVILNEGNMGYAKSNNRGAAAAEGEVLAFLNNDLVLGGGWLGPMLSALNSMGGRAGIVGNVQVNPSTGEVDHAGIVINLKGKPDHVRKAPSLFSRVFRPVRPVAAATGACLLIRAETWRKLGGFDEGYLNGCEDVDLCLRARAAGLGTVVALRSRILHHVSSSPGRNLRHEENARRLFLKWRSELAILASRKVTGRMFLRYLAEPRNIPSVPMAIWVAAYAAHIHSRPPSKAVTGMLRNIDVELARWRELFSG